MLCRVRGIDFNMIEINPTYVRERQRQVSIWDNAEGLQYSDSRDVPKGNGKRVS